MTLGHLQPSGTHIAEPPFVSRLRVARLLDRKPSTPLSIVKTPDGKEIPYAIPLAEYLSARPESLPLPYRIAGKASGEVVCGMNDARWRTVIYDNFSNDGKTFMDGEFATKSPSSIFDAGENIIRAKLKIWGEHTGEADYRMTFIQENVMSPVKLSFGEANDHSSATFGYSLSSVHSLKQTRLIDTNYIITPGVLCSSLHALTRRSGKPSVFPIMMHCFSIPGYAEISAKSRNRKYFNTFVLSVHC